MPREILDSEDDGAFEEEKEMEREGKEEKEEGLSELPTAAVVAESEPHVPTSGELRQQAIDAALKVLIAPGTIPSPENEDERCHHHHGMTMNTSALSTNEAPSTPQKDIYDFDEEDNDDPPLPTSLKKKTTQEKRRRTTTNTRATRINGEESDFGGSKKPLSIGSAKKQRSKTMPVVPVIDISSEDEYDPNPRDSTNPKGRKSTGSNTSDHDLLPLLPKPKRKKRDLTKELQDYLPLPLGDDSARTSPQKTFIIDMTHEGLMLPAQKKMEYDKLYGAHPALENIKLLSDGTPVLDSTIPDPPGLLEKLGPSGSLAPRSGSSDRDMDIPLLESKLPSSPPMRQKKRRSKTDPTMLGGFDSDHGIRIASEWRVAKGKGRQNLSDKSQLQRQQRDSSFVDELNIEVQSDSGLKSTKKKAQRNPKEPVAKQKKGRKSKLSEQGDLDGVANSVQISSKAPDIQDTTMASNGGKVSETIIDIDDMGNHLSGPGPTPKLAIKLEVNKKKNYSPPPAPVVETSSPERPARRTKSRFIVDSEGDMDGLLSSPPLSTPQLPLLPEPLKETAKSAKVRPKPASRMKSIAASSDEGEYSDVIPVVHEKPLVAKRKRTKTGETSTAGDAPPPAKKIVTTRRKSSGKKLKPNEVAIEEGGGGLEVKEAIVTISEEPRLLPPEVNLVSDEDSPRTGPKIPAPVSPERQTLKSSEQRQKGSHSPLRGGKVPYRVGLSKRARIEPLLSIRKK